MTIKLTDAERIIVEKALAAYGLEAQKAGGSAAWKSAQSDACLTILSKLGRAAHLSKTASVNIARTIALAERA